MSVNEVVLSKNEIQEVSIEKLDLNQLGLSKADLPQVIQVAKAFDSQNSIQLAEFGKDIAKNTSANTDKLLDMVKARDLDETGKKLNMVLKHAQDLNVNSLTGGNPKGLMDRIFGKFRGVKQTFQQEFNTTKEQIDLLVSEVENSQVRLKDRMNFLERMHESIKDERHNLGIHIAAGKLKIDELQSEIAEFSVMAESSTEAAEKVYALNDIANKLEKRVSDLTLLQHSAQQTMPMIKIISSNNQMLVDKFYSIKNITLPAWKNQISLSLSLQEQKAGVALAKTVDDATNDLLKRNADLLHQNSVDVARANQRSVIDIETLEHVQEKLFATVKETLEIQKEGMQKRDEAAIKLKNLQNAYNSLVFENTDKYLN